MAPSRLRLEVLKTIVHGQEAFSPRRVLIESVGCCARDTRDSVKNRADDENMDAWVAAKLSRCSLWVHNQ